MSTPILNLRSIRWLVLVGRLTDVVVIDRIDRRRLILDTIFSECRCVTP